MKILKRYDPKKIDGCYWCHENNVCAIIIVKFCVGAMCGCLLTLIFKSF